MKIKTHYKKYEKYYIFLGGMLSSGILVGITYTIMRERSSSQHINRGISVVADRGISVIADRSVVTNNVSFISSRRSGAPSWVVHCEETGDIFKSQREAATTMNLSEKELSHHLNGKMDHVRGYHFRRIALAA